MAGHSDSCTQEGAEPRPQRETPSVFLQRRLLDAAAAAILSELAEDLPDSPHNDLPEDETAELKSLPTDTHIESIGRLSDCRC